MDTTTDGVFRDVRYTGGGRRRTSRRPTVRSVNRKVNGLFKKLNREVEVKQKLGTITEGPNTNIPIVTVVNLLAQGNDYNQREGDTVSMKSVAWRMGFNLDSAEVADASVRFLWVYDRDTDGAVGTYTGMFTSDSVLSLVENRGNTRGRYQILYDKTFVFDKDGKGIMFNKGYIDLKNKQVQYNNTTAAIASVSKGALYQVVISSGNTLACLMTLKYRLRYTDM